MTNNKFKIISPIAIDLGTISTKKLSNLAKNSGFDSDWVY